MKIAGVIAECNPFHEGHRYLIEQARALTGADAVVVLLSGDFVQRGAPAIEPKETRVRAVLKSGADIVLELPVLYASASAEYFAGGAVSILNRLGGVTDLVFGSESGELSRLGKNASYLLGEPQEFRDALKRNLARGMSFPAARSEAAREASNMNLFDTPNDLLATEYLLELLKLQREGECRLKPHAVRRIDTASASELRAERLRSDPQAVSADDFSQALYYALRSVLREERTNPGTLPLQDFLDVSPDFADKIRRDLSRYAGWSSFTDLLKSKDLTYTRVSRALLHVLLGIRKNDLAVFRMPGYVRLLGMREGAGSAAGTLAGGSIPLIAALGQDQARLEPPYDRMLQLDLFASDLYDEVYAAKTGQEKVISEYYKKVIRV